MAFDFKKADSDLYGTKQDPVLVRVPPISYLAVWGMGDPNEPEGAYQQAIRILYALAYTVKMSRKKGWDIPGYFDYVVPPLEGFWEGDIASGDKSTFRWISVLRVPEFVEETVFARAVTEASAKKKLDCSAAELLTMDEGLCVQALHLGVYDTEPETIARMNAFLDQQGYATDLSDARLHHEIYLSNPSRTAPEKRKTIIRHPVRKY